MSRKTKLSLKEARTFLNDPRFRKCLVFLFFVMLSTLFWTLQTLRDTLETEIKLPISLTDVPDNVIITTDLPPMVEFRLRDKGAILARYLFGEKMQPLELNFATYDRGRTSDHVLVPQADIARLIQQQYPGSTQIDDIFPDTIDFFFTRERARKYPIKIAGQATARTQYYIAGLKCYPDSVEVYASAHTLDTLNNVYTIPINWRNLTESQMEEVRLQSKKGVKYKNPIVQVKATVGCYIEKTIELPIENEGFPDGKMLRLFPSKAKVTFRVGESEATRNWNQLLRIVVRYNELQADEAKIQLELEEIPNGVDNIHIQPQEVDFLIEDQEEDNELPQTVQPT